jgi:hypothetical protein
MWWLLPVRVRHRSRRSQRTSDFGVVPAELCCISLDVEDGLRPGTTAVESAEIPELKRRNRLLEQENEILRRAAAYLSQASPPGKMMYPLFTEQAVDGIPVTVTWRVLKLARLP